MSIAAKLLGTATAFVGTGTVLAVGILAAVHALIPADALDDEHDEDHPEDPDRARDWAIADAQGAY